MTENKRELVNEIYDHVLHVVNRALKNAENYSIAVLKLENPSYAQIAEQLRKVCEIMDLLADEIGADGENDAEPVHTVSKAKEYTQSIAAIAEAINADDEAALRRLCKELDRRPFK